MDATDVTQARLDALDCRIGRLDSVVVAFSGGTDSTLLLAACLRKLGAGRVLAATADSPTLPRRELEETHQLALELGAPHEVIRTDELANRCFAENSSDRCFHCKRELFAALRAMAERDGFKYVAYGATQDDLTDFRPGLRAAEQAGAVAPLLEAGFTKQDVRDVSVLLGLRTALKPAKACLASRVPYGTRITRDNLAQVEQAENALLDELGLAQVRVRHHGDIARIEVPAGDIATLLGTGTRSRVVERLKELGFLYVTLDLAGFRSGSMNDVLQPREPHYGPGAGSHAGELGDPKERS